MGKLLKQVVLKSIFLSLKTVMILKCIIQKQRIVLLTFQKHARVNVFSLIQI